MSIQKRMEQVDEIMSHVRKHFSVQSNENTVLTCIDINFSISNLKRDNEKKRARHPKSTNAKFNKLRHAIFMLNQALKDLGGEFSIEEKLMREHAKMIYETYAKEVATSPDGFVIESNSTSITIDSESEFDQDELKEFLENSSADTSIYRDPKLMIDKYGENFTGLDIHQELTKEESNIIWREAYLEALKQWSSLRSLATEYNALLEDNVNPDEFKGRGNKRNMPMRKFVLSVAVSLHEATDIDFKVSSAENSSFIKFLSDILPLAGVHLSTSSIRDHVRSMIKETGAVNWSKPS